MKLCYKKWEDSAEDQVVPLRTDNELPQPITESRLLHSPVTNVNSVNSVDITS